MCGTNLRQPCSSCFLFTRQDHRSTIDPHLMWTLSQLQHNLVLQSPPQSVVVVMDTQSGPRSNSFSRPQLWLYKCALPLIETNISNCLDGVFLGH